MDASTARRRGRTTHRVQPPTADVKCLQCPWRFHPKAGGIATSRKAARYHVQTTGHGVEMVTTYVERYEPDTKTAPAGATTPDED